jgi:hypothetical protein
VLLARGKLLALISWTPHDPQKRFPGGFSWRHRGHGTCCSVMFVSPSSRRSTGLYTNADRNARKCVQGGLEGTSVGKVTAKEESDVLNKRRKVPTAPPAPPLL